MAALRMRLRASESAIVVGRMTTPSTGTCEDCCGVTVVQYPLMPRCRHPRLTAIARRTFAGSLVDGTSGAIEPVLLLARQVPGEVLAGHGGRAPRT